MSQLVVDYLADEIVRLREYHRTRHSNRMRMYRSSQSGPVPTEVTIGGLVRSYTFRYTANSPAVQGTMTVQLDSGRCHDFAATVVILGGSPDEGIKAQEMVAETHKISDCSDAVVEAYFSAYCNDIRRYIVVYEPFDLGRLNPPASFLRDDKLDLSDYWRDQVRAFIEALSLAKVRGVVHGNLRRSNSYVMSAGRAKIINVGRTIGRHQMMPAHDLDDLRFYIWNNQSFDAKSCGNWESLDYLLGSKKMAEENCYYEDVLKHPVLLKPVDRIDTYAELGIFMWNELNAAGRKEFANALYVKMPQYRGENIENIFDMTNVPYSGIFNFEEPHDIIYLAIIQFVRNIIKHANDHLIQCGYQAWDEVQMCEEIEVNLSSGLFRGMAYSLRLEVRTGQTCSQVHRLGSYMPTLFESMVAVEKLLYRSLRRHFKYP